MKKFVLILFFSIACGSDKNPQQQEILTDNFGSITNDQTEISNDNLQLIANIFFTYREFAIQNVSITIDQNASTDYCGNETDACTHDTTKGEIQSSIYAPWGLRNVATWISAELIAHELCHAYYFATTGDGDANHIHHECFARQDLEYASYAGEIGTATLVGKDFASAGTTADTGNQ